MKFGYMFDFRQPPGTPNENTRAFYPAMFEQIDFLDQAGFDSIWITEHHFVDDGYLAAAMPMMAAIAARTRRATIGSFVILAPFYNPLRLAEDTALIDAISGGRLRLGIGLGYRLEEFAVFQVPRKERLGRTLETVEILKRAWSGERFSFEGKYFKFHDARVMPRPLSDPYPELLWGGMAPEAIRRAAKLDMGFACNLGAREVTTYHDALRELGKDPAKYNIVNSRLVFVADSEEEAWHQIAPHLQYQMSIYAKWLSEGGITTGGHFDSHLEGLRRSAVLGPPDRVVEQLRSVIAKTPMTEMVLSMQLPGLDPKFAMRSLKRFTADALPALRA